MQFTNDILEKIANELHTQNILIAEQNKVLEFVMPPDCQPSVDLLPFSRKFSTDNYKSEGVV